MVHGIYTKDHVVKTVVAELETTTGHCIMIMNNDTGRICTVIIPQVLILRVHSAPYLDLCEKSTSFFAKLIGDLRQLIYTTPAPLQLIYTTPTHLHYSAPRRTLSTPLYQ